MWIKKFGSEFFFWSDGVIYLMMMMMMMGGVILSYEIGLEVLGFY